jgi:hypothetical protein
MIVSAKAPASGLNASAACAEVSILVLPFAWRVEAVVMIMAMPMIFDKAIPTSVSIRMRVNSASVFDGVNLSGFLSGSIRCSSASCEDCQIKRYGEIVVPRSATNVVRNAPSHWIVGTRRPRRASDHGTFTTARAAT